MRTSDGDDAEKLQEEEGIVIPDGTRCSLDEDGYVVAVPPGPRLTKGNG
jgi:hypothetical protein